MLEHRNVCAGIGEGNVVEGKGVLTVVTFFDRECAYDMDGCAMKSSYVARYELI